MILTDRKYNKTYRIQVEGRSCGDKAVSVWKGGKLGLGLYTLVFLGEQVSPTCRDSIIV